MHDALGMLEVKGYVAAIEFADVMVKAADVKIVKIKMTRGMGWMTIFVEGNVAAVQASIRTAQTSAVESNQFVSAKVIPRPHEDLSIFLESTDVTKKQNKSEEEKQPKIENKQPANKAGSNIRSSRKNANLSKRKSITTNKSLPAKNNGTGLQKRNSSTKETTAVNKVDNQPKKNN